MSLDLGSNLVTGRYVTVFQWSHYLDDVTKMILEHYDTNEYADSVFLLCVNLKYPIHQIREIFPGKRLIIYQLEQLVSCNTLFPVDFIVDSCRYVDEVWDYDALNMVYYEKYTSFKGAKFMPFRYCKSLERIPNSERDIDVLFYGSLNLQRTQWQIYIQEYFYDKVSTVFASGTTPKQNDDFIRRAKIVLNIHLMHPYSRQEQPRLFLPVINNRCVVSEVSQLNHMEGCVVEVTLDTVSRELESILGNKSYDSLALQANLKYKRMTYTDEDYERYRQTILSRVGM